ncbi:hypothetical protein BDV29DRAFT_162873 [Aspergillus leporis]|uniref:Uncharacterized protein n=1 Tax=Aspergillus leporis TaxID=41062 RepID=A0A5N5WKT7_9EURO|nr:hypothetical protein BDV29DRAFT_162873 [Aspergillus leporis]
MPTPVIQPVADRLLDLSRGGHLTREQLIQLRTGGRGAQARPIGPVGALAASARSFKSRRSSIGYQQGPSEKYHEEEYRRLSDDRPSSRNPRKRLQNRGCPIGKVLYMMIVNLPLDEEMAAAQAALRS